MMYFWGEQHLRMPLIPLEFSESRVMTIKFQRVRALP